MTKKPAVTGWARGCIGLPSASRPSALLAQILRLYKVGTQNLGVYCQIIFRSGLILWWFELESDDSDGRLRCNTLYVAESRRTDTCLGGRQPLIISDILVPRIDQAVEASDFQTLTESCFLVRVPMLGMDCDATTPWQAHRPLDGQTRGEVPTSKVEISRITGLVLRCPINSVLDTRLCEGMAGLKWGSNARTI